MKMKIRKIEPISTIDFPGVVSVVVYTVGCNFKCPYCYNYLLFDEAPDDISMTDALNEINDNPLINGVTITGGEPTIHPELLEFIKALKEIGLKVKLDTNGSNPTMLNMCLPYVDYVAMDIKTGLNTYHLVRCLARPENIQMSIIYLKNSGIPHEFRVTCIEPFVNHKNIDYIGRMLKGADKVHLQKGRLEDVYEPEINMKASDIEKLKYYQSVLLRYVKNVELRL